MEAASNESQNSNITSNINSNIQPIMYLCLNDQIAECFDEKKYFLGIFVDLSKAFGTAGHWILITKLENNYGVWYVVKICCGLKVIFKQKTVYWI